MGFNYILSQVAVIIAYVLCGIGFLHKDKLKILQFSICFNVILIIQYAFLNGTMGIVACVINTIRNIFFAYNEKCKKQNSVVVLFILFGITLFLTAYFYKSPIDLVPCFLALIGTYAYWSPSTKVVRICNLFCSVCYMIYAIPIRSFMIIVCEAYLSITTIIGFVRNEKINNLNKKVA